MAASTTTNYGWTEIDPDKEIDIAGDVNTPLEQIDASLKSVANSASGSYTAGNGISIGNDAVIAIANPAVNDINQSWSECTARLGTPGIYSHAEGSGTAASGKTAHAEGSLTKASGACSHAECYSTTADGDYSHAEGYITTASGLYSHAEGYDTTASGTFSHAEGYSSKASGYSSHAEGFITTAVGDYQHVFGYNNISDSTSLEIVGNGSDQTALTTIKSNARTLDKDGNQWTAGDVTCDAVQGDHTNLYSLRSIGAIVASIPTIEYGVSNSISVSANSHTVVDVTFGSTKTEAPAIFPSIQCPTAGVNLIATVQSVTNAQASIVVTNLGTTDVSDVTVDWLALSGR